MLTFVFFQPFIIEESTQSEAPASTPVVNVSEVVAALFAPCIQGKNGAETASAFAKKVAGDMGIQQAFSEGELSMLLSKAFAEKKNTFNREGVMYVMSALASLGPVSLPYLIPQIPMILDGIADTKQKNVPKIAKAAFQAVMDLVTPIPFAIKAVLPYLLAPLSLETVGWQAKQVALTALASFNKSAPAHIDRYLPEIIPVVSSLVWDSKPEVANAAATVLTNVCKQVTNPDLHPFIPALVGAIKKPSLVPETVYKLASTTFVTTVEAPSLAIMAPILERGLAESARATLRQTAVIIDNMCK